MVQSALCPAPGDGVNCWDRVYVDLSGAVRTLHSSRPLARNLSVRDAFKEGIDAITIETVQSFAGACTPGQYDPQQFTVLQRATYRPLTQQPI